MKPTIAIIGASEQRHKFGNKAVRAYLRQGWDVYPVNPRSATIEGLPAYRSIRDVPLAELDRVSIYLPPEVGLQIVDDLAGKRCKEVWLNPGAASAEVVQRGKELALKMVLGCSIVAVGVSPDELD
jgi:uncharacterized protein